MSDRDETIGRISKRRLRQARRAGEFAVGLLLCWLCVLPAGAQTLLGTAFTYQGRLTAAGSPADGGYDLRFTIFDALSVGNAVGAPVTVSSVAVVAGLFTVSLDFGASAFVGGKRWLEIGVKPAGSPGGYTLLAPRQELTPSPNAVFSATTGDASVQRRTVAPSCSAGQYVRAIGADGTPTCDTDLNSGGTVTSVTAGSGLSGGTIVGAGTVAIAPGGVVSGMIASGAVGLAKLSTLNGAAAGRVLGTDGSNLQWQTAPAAGITYVTPASVAAGRTSTVNVIGEATSFDGTTIFSAGSGVIVFSTVAVSRAALQVTLSVAPGAAVGNRTISVSTGAQVLTLPNGLLVAPPLSAVVTSGELSQGGSALVLAQPAAGRTFAPAIASSVLTVGNATFTPSPGLSIVSNRWLGSNTAELLVEVSPFADSSSSANLAVNYTGGGTDSVFGFAPIGFNPVTPVALGTPESGALLIAREAGLFSIAVANAPSTLQFTVSPEVGAVLAPRVRVYPGGSPTPIADVTAASGTATFATNGIYVFSVVDRNGGGGFTGYNYTFVLNP